MKTITASLNKLRLNNYTEPGRLTKYKSENNLGGYIKISASWQIIEQSCSCLESASFILSRVWGGKRDENDGF
jgi:hypothetical protein